VGGAEIAEVLGSQASGRHVLMLFDSIESCRDAYCRIARTRLVQGGMVVLLPYFETVETVVHNLREYGVQVDKYRNGSSLVILDAVRQFFGAGQDFADYIREIRRQAENTGRSSVTVVADITAFHHFDDVEGMLQYEREMQRLLLEMPNVSVLCCYHKGNFEGLSHYMQNAVFACHTFVIDEKTGY
jgi:hypothetical protein